MEVQRLPGNPGAPPAAGQAGQAGRSRGPFGPPRRRVRLPAFRGRRPGRSPAFVFVLGIAILIALGAVLLSLPAASAGGHWTAPQDALFTSASAVSVTGLAVVDTATYWSPFGQGVILLLVQLGGLGFMTNSTLLLLLMRRQATLRERVLLDQSLGGWGLGSALGLARRILVFTLAVEATGTALLTLRFLRDHGPLEALWQALFLSVAGFNNAGFDLSGDFLGLTPYSTDPAVLLPVLLMVVLGGLSFTAVEDVVKRRDATRLTLDTKLVLVTTAGVVAVGSLGLLLTERANPLTLGQFSVWGRLLNALFLSAASRTSGYNAVPVGDISDAGLLLLMALMFIGGATGSTAGGIKVQTFSLLLFAIFSTSAGAQEVQAFRRRVPTAYVLRALSIALLSLAFVFLVALVLSLTEGAAFVDLAFESVSAFSTAGLSTGITPELSPVGRFILSATMFAGRLGPLTLALALAAREHRVTYRWAQEGVKIG
jgi:trk system potassium uptake protein TrkH